MALVGRSPLLEAFQKGLVTPDLKRLAARGALGLRVREQLQVFVWLAGDADAGIAELASTTIDAMPRDGLAAFLALPDVSDDIRAFFAARGFSVVSPAGAVPRVAADGATLDEVVFDTAPDDVPVVPEARESPADDGESEGEVRGAALALLPVIDRVKLAMRGTREQRAVLIRDPNRMVASAVLSSPKLTDSEIEAFARMANVSEEVLRVIGLNRHWTRSYAVVLGLTRNPKTPLAVSMSFVPRLHERDLKHLSIDRNVPEGLRLAARKLMTSARDRRH